MTSENAIVVRDLRKSFGDATVLDGVDLDVHTGEVTLLMGENGSGKTILLSCLAGGLRPTGGTVELFGGSPSDARSRLSFMLQGGLTLSELTGRENARFYHDLHPRATDEWETIADRLGIAGDLDESVRDYSGGMVRKLELAITFGVDVPLYLLDEPTAELDLSAIDLVHALIEERRQAGRTIVLSSHTPADIQLADRIAFVRNGRISTVGEPDELLAKVPRVALARTRVQAEQLSEFVVEGRLFESSEGRRGFVRPDVEEENLPSEVSVSDPSWTDLFNCYAHVDELANRRSEPMRRASNR